MMQQPMHFVMPAEGGVFVNPEMMQGMQAMPVPVMMGPMGPMMAAPMPAGMMPGAMAAPQLTQMLVEAARGGRSSNVFFKTRICNKWRAGACPYGDKCTYAHGEHELRYVPPEIVAQLEAQQKMQDAGGQRVGSGEGGDRGRGDDGSAAGPGGGAHGGGPGGGHQSFYKTRLCIKYMQTGYCHKGASCTFAHGYEDLRQPGTPISPGRMQQDSMSPGRIGMAPAPGMPMMAPAGMMAPMAMPPAGMAGGRGMAMPPGAAAGMAMGAMQMALPMAGMPAHMAAGGRYNGSQQQGGMQRSPRASGGHGGREDPAAAARRRATAMCQLAGVGDAGSQELQPGAMQAAMADLHSKAAAQESPYADAVTDYVPASGMGSGHGAAGGGS
ncbi:hypothetical protein ABPG77_006827 [Micractinium sp. CCAP 211/92]